MPTLFQQLRTLRESRLQHYPWGPHGPYIAPPWAAARLGKRVFASKAEYRKLVLKDYNPHGRHHPAAVAARIAAREPTAAMDVDSWNEGDSYSLINDQHLGCLKRRTCGDVDLRMGHAIRRCVRTSEDEFEILSDIAAFMSFRPTGDYQEEIHSAAYGHVDYDIVAVKDEPTEGVIPARVSSAEGHLFVKQEDEQQLLRFAQSLTYLHEQPVVEDVVAALNTPAPVESYFVQGVATEATSQVAASIVKVEPSPSVENTYALKAIEAEPVLATPCLDEITVSMSVDLIPPTACAWADEFAGVEPQFVVVGASSGPQVKAEQEDVIFPPAIVAEAQALDHPLLCAHPGREDLVLPPPLIEEDVEMAQPQAHADVAPCPDIKEEELDKVYFDDLLLAVALYGGSVQPPASLPADVLPTSSVALPEEDIEMGVPVALQEHTPAVATVEPTLHVVHDVLAAPAEPCIKAESEDDAANLLVASEVPSEVLLVQEEPVECVVPCLPSVAELPQPEDELASTVIQPVPEDDLAPIPCSLEECTSPVYSHGDHDFTTSPPLEGDSTLVCEELEEAAVPDDEAQSPSEVAEELSASDALEDPVTLDKPDELLYSEEDPVELGTTEVQVTITDLDAPACSPSLHSIHQPRDVDLEDEDAVRVCEESETSEYTQVVLECPPVTEEDSFADVNVSVEEDVETYFAEDEPPSMDTVDSSDEISGLETSVAEDESQMPGSWIPVPESHASESAASSLSYRRLGSVVGRWSRRLAKTFVNIGHAIASEDTTSTEPFPAMVGAYPPDTSELLASGTEEEPSQTPTLTLSPSALAILQEYACAPPLPSWCDDINTNLWPLSSPPSFVSLGRDHPSEQPQPRSPEFASNFVQAPCSELVCRPPLLSIPTRTSLGTSLEHNVPEASSDVQDEALKAPLLQPHACMQSLGFLQCVTPFITAVDFFDSPYDLAPDSQSEEECPSDSDQTCVSSERGEDTVKGIDESGVQELPSATRRCDIQRSALRDVLRSRVTQLPRITFEDVWESARAQIYTEEAIAERAAHRKRQAIERQAAQAFVDKVIADIRRGAEQEHEQEPQHEAEHLTPMEEYMLSIEGIYKEIDNLLEVYAPPEEPARSMRTLFDEAPELVVTEQDSEEYWRTPATIDLSAPGPFSDRLRKAARESFWSNWTRPSVEDLAAVFKPSEVPPPGPIISIKNASIAPTPVSEPSPTDHYRESLMNSARDAFWWHWSRPSGVDLNAVSCSTTTEEDERERPVPIVYNFSPVKPLRIVKKNKAPAPLN
ncbi:hypothetical protein ONZ51_g11024 [Trametes cubensis]|uniref:Uncharacterized protein n=1 Tax=Trametes cubensis TaxID=1111947 RepID=A0AAD7X654_9APHY|nr:hypothetical protein ONZ51_g11024 [Trametes cubensis]